MKVYIVWIGKYDTKYLYASLDEGEALSALMELEENDYCGVWEIELDDRSNLDEYIADMRRLEDMARELEQNSLDT